MFSTPTRECVREGLETKKWCISRSVRFAASRLSPPRRTASPSLAINNNKYESRNFNYVMLPGYRASQRCRFPFVSANEQPVAPTVQGHMRLFENIIKWNVSVLDCSLGRNWERLFSFLFKKNSVIVGVDKEVKYFETSWATNWSRLQSQMIRLFGLTGTGFSFL